MTQRKSIIDVLRASSLIQTSEDRIQNAIRIARESAAGQGQTAGILKQEANRLETTERALVEILGLVQEIKAEIAAAAGHAAEDAEIAQEQAKKLPDTLTLAINLAEVKRLLGKDDEPPEE